MYSIIYVLYFQQFNFTINIIYSGFMCNGDCVLPQISVQHALLYIVMTIGTTSDLTHTLGPMLERTREDWGSSLDKKQVNMIVKFIFL